MAAVVKVSQIFEYKFLSCWKIHLPFSFAIFPLIIRDLFCLVSGDKNNNKMRTYQKLTTVLHLQTNEAKKQIQKFAKKQKASSRRTWRNKQDLTDKNIYVFLLVPLLVKLLSMWDISTSCTYHVQSHLRHQVPLSIKKKKSIICTQLPKSKTISVQILLTKNLTFNIYILQDLSCKMWSV